MGTSVKLKIINDGVSRHLRELMDRSRKMEGYLQRVVLNQYLNAQRERFEKENDGGDFDGGPWGALDHAYSEYKRKKYSSYPGGGSKILIRTSRLINSLLLQPNEYDEPTWGKGNWEHRKLKGKRRTSQSKGSEFGVLINSSSIHINTMIPYASYVDEERTFSNWSESFWAKIKSGAIDYMLGR